MKAMLVVYGFVALAAMFLLCGGCSEYSNNPPDLVEVTDMANSSKTEEPFSVFITSEPTAGPTGILTVFEKESIAFKATVTGSQGDPAMYKYMWQMSTDDGTTWTDVVADDNCVIVSNILKINSILPEHNGIYRCVVDDGQN